MLYIAYTHEEGITCVAIEEPVYVRRQRNGTLVRCNSPALAQGVVSPDGVELWHLADKPPLGESYLTVTPITMTEYLQWLAQGMEEPDPEDTEPVIPEGVDPVTVLTRAELTEKVSELDEALHMLLSGVTEDE